mgnify:CR=1 FL=1
MDGRKKLISLIITILYVCSDIYLNGLEFLGVIISIIYISAILILISILILIYSDSELQPSFSNQSILETLFTLAILIYVYVTSFNIFDLNININMSPLIERELQDEIKILSETLYYNDITLLNMGLLILYLLIVLLAIFKIL